jgi:hypothetical protein
MLAGSFAELSKMVAGSLLTLAGCLQAICEALQVICRNYAGDLQEMAHADMSAGLGGFNVAGSILSVSNTCPTITDM